MRYHVSGQLKVAPEHVSPNALKYMGKPKQEVFDRFVQKYEEANRRAGMKQFLVPYFMSSHPGCTLDDAVLLAQYMKKTGLHPEQVQDFYPTPGTLSTAMFYTGLDPRDMSPVYVPRDPKEKAMQRALMQYQQPQYRDLARQALRAAGRADLIGYGPECLLPPREHREDGAARRSDSDRRKDGGQRRDGYVPARKGGAGDSGAHRRNGGEAPRRYADGRRGQEEPRRARHGGYVIPEKRSGRGKKR